MAEATFPQPDPPTGYPRQINFSGYTLTWTPDTVENFTRDNFSGDQQGGWYHGTQEHMYQSQYNSPGDLYLAPAFVLVVTLGQLIVGNQAYLSGQEGHTGQYGGVSSGPFELSEQLALGTFDFDNGNWAMNNGAPDFEPLAVADYFTPVFTALDVPTYPDPPEGFPQQINFAGRTFTWISDKYAKEFMHLFVGDATNDGFWALGSVIDIWLWFYAPINGQVFPPVTPGPEIGYILMQKNAADQAYIQLSDGTSTTESVFGTIDDLAGALESGNTNFYSGEWTYGNEVDNRVMDPDEWPTPAWLTDNTLAPITDAPNYRPFTEFDDAADQAELTRAKGFKIEHGFCGKTGFRARYGFTKANGF